MYYNHLRNDLVSPSEEEERNKYLDFLADSALALVKGGRIYGRPIDTTNSRDVIALLYLAFLDKDYLVRIERENIDV